MIKTLLSLELQELEKRLKELQNNIIKEEESIEGLLNEIIIVQTRLRALSFMLIESYIKHCFNEGIKSRDKEWVYDEISSLFKFI